MRRSLALVSLVFGSTFLAVPSGAQTKPHVLMISIDGMRPDYITQAAAHRVDAPTLIRFMQEGTFAQGVVGVFPTMTYPSHTTLVTGVWPAQHGIYNNARFRPLEDPTKAVKATYQFAREVKVESLWTAAKKVGLTTASISWPVTGSSPSIDWNGSGAGTDSLWPGDPADRRSNTADLSKERMSSDKDAHRTAWAVEMIGKDRPNFITVHLGLADEAQHEHGPFSPEAIKALETIDAEVAKIVAAELAVDPKATVFVVSDHGFVPVSAKVNLSILLVRAGLIKIAPFAGGGENVKIVDWDAELWESGGSASVMLKNPEDKAVYNMTYAVLAEAMKNPAYGIDRILTRDQFVPKGGNPHASFMIALKPGFKASYNLTGEIVESTPGVGTHGYLPDNEPGVRSSFFVMGSGIAKGRDLGIVDMRQIAPTVARTLGAVLPEATQPALNIRD